MGVQGSIRRPLGETYSMYDLASDREGANSISCRRDQTKHNVHGSEGGDAVRLKRRPALPHPQKEMLLITVELWESCTTARHGDDAWGGSADINRTSWAVRAGGCRSRGMEAT